MFGFLPAPCGCLSADDRSVYRAHFCGLCNALRGRYGLWSRFLVNRDAAFLSLLGSALSRSGPAVTRATCCNPLAAPRSLVQSAPHVHYAAAVTMCGLAVKLEDDADDERGWHGHVAAVGHAALRPCIIEAVGVLESTGFPVGETLEFMRSQKGEESLADVTPTGAAMPTRRAYGNIFAHLQKIADAPESQAEPLREIGGHLGELIYIADAWDDHAADRKRGRFNPLPDDAAARRGVVGEIGERCIAGIKSAFGALQLHGMMPLTGHLLLSMMPAATRRRFQIIGAGARDTRLLGPSSGRKNRDEGLLEREGRRRRGPECCDCDPGCCDCCDCVDCDCHGCHGCDGCDGCHGCDGCDCSCH